MNLIFSLLQVAAIFACVIGLAQFSVWAWQKQKRHSRMGHQTRAVTQHVPGS